MVLILICSLLFFGTQIVLAQDLGIAQPIHIEQTDLPDGTVISHTENSYHPSLETYDKSVFGIVSREPALELSYSDDLTTTPVVNTGLAPIRVNLESGPIKKGDSLTTSSTPGVAMKATKTGFMIGVAQEGYEGQDSAQEGVILMSTDIKFSFAQDSPASEKIGTRLLDVIKLSSLAVVEQPSVVFRYVVVALLMMGSVIFTFFNFARAAHNGTEALGRNPLASRQIILGMFLNVAISLGILGSGLAAAALIMSAKG